MGDAMQLIGPRKEETVDRGSDQQLCCPAVLCTIKAIKNRTYQTMKTEYRMHSTQDGLQNRRQTDRQALEEEPRGGVVQKADTYNGLGVGGRKELCV